MILDARVSVNKFQYRMGQSAIFFMEAPLN